MQAKDDERLLDRNEVEERFGVSKRFLEIAMQRGDGPCYVRVGRLVKYRPKDVSDWIEANSTPRAKA